MSECVASMAAGGLEVLHRGAGEGVSVLVTRQVVTDIRYPPFDMHRLQLCLSGRLAGVQESGGGEPAIAYRASPGSLHFMPAGRASRVRDEGGGTCLHVLITRWLMDEVAATFSGKSSANADETVGANAPPIPPGPFGGVLDESIHACLVPMHRALLAPGRGLAPRLDALARAVCVGLLERSAATAPTRGERLSPARLALALEALEREVSENAGLAAVARAVGLSAHHFSRAFRNTAGLSPYRHVSRRRVARAAEMLVSGDVSLADVAKACGYSSQTHMTSTFRRHLGTTPARYRNAHRR